MAINRGTLGQTIDGVVEYIYPKTEADLVEYDENYDTIKDKIEAMEKEFAEYKNSMEKLINSYEERIKSLEEKLS